jgi:hypothetical protein
LEALVEVLVTPPTPFKNVEFFTARLSQKIKAKNNNKKPKTKTKTEE